jgi:hypothetical protein
MIPFPSINQFRSVIAHVKRNASFMGIDDAGEPIYNHAARLPVLSFVGTVKLHGTNAAIVFDHRGLTFQSRERVLSLTSDNAGFYAHMRQLDNVPAIRDLFDVIAKSVGLESFHNSSIAIYGEWCGGNIQKGVAISGLPKMFVIFAIKVNGEWLQRMPEGLMNKEASIYSIYQFVKWFVNIDFESPEKAQNHLAALTEEVEAKCPVGENFGQLGIGEGIVWRCIDDPSSGLWFKVKGEKHSASKVKTLASVDVEAVENIREFVETTVTEARLEQGLHNLVNEQGKSFEMVNIGDFIRWVHHDVMKEEEDTVLASGIDAKKLGGPIAQAAKRWYVERLNKEVFQPA